MLARLLPILAAALWLAPPASGQGYLWSPATGVSMCGFPCRADYHLVVPDGAGGVFVAWTDMRDGPTSDTDAYLQRITATGQIAPGWPVDGLSLCSLPQLQSPQAIAPDGEGGMFVTWYDGRSIGPTFGTGFDVYVQRVRGDGTLAPGWTPNGVAATTALHGQYPEAIAPDGSGGAYVVWRDERDYPTQGFDVYAQHLTAGGSVTGGWPVDGLPVCTAPGFQNIISAVPDGTGGVVVVWSDCRACSNPNPKQDIYGQRLLADGTVAPGWSANGSLLVAERGIPGIAPDGGGGFYIASTAVPEAQTPEHWVQRFTFAGTPSPGWPAEGVRVCGAPGERHPPRVAPDGFGGVLLTWSDFRGPGPAVIFTARVQPDGSRAPGWTTDGVPVSQILGGRSFEPEVVADGLGGAYVCWEWTDFATWSNTARVQHLTAEGAVAPGWPAGGVPVATSLSQYFPRVVTDGAGGAIVVWEERGTPPRAGLFAQRFGPGGATPVLLSLAHAEAEPDRVRLRWQGPGAGSLAASVQRREAAGAWEHLGAAVPEGADALAYEDRAVRPGTRYGYRLGYVEEGALRFTGETWVEVPAAARFALRGLSPNPSAGDPVVEFSLAGAAPASLEIYDLHGRRVFAREVGGLGAGLHRVAIAEQGRLPAGIYGVRLRQGDLSASARAVVLR